MSELVSGGRVWIGRLWSGGVATAVIAGLIAVVGIFLARGLFDVPVPAPEGRDRGQSGPGPRSPLSCCVRPTVRATRSAADRFSTPSLR
jgi:hypothetical protein